MSARSALVRVCERHVCDVLCGLGDADGRRRHNSLSVRRLAARTAERIIVYYNLHRAEVFARAFFFTDTVLRCPQSGDSARSRVKSQVRSCGRVARPDAIRRALRVRPRSRRNWQRGRPARPTWPCDATSLYLAKIADLEKHMPTSYVVSGKQRVLLNPQR